MSILTKSNIGMKHHLLISWNGHRYDVLVKSVTVEDMPPQKRDISFIPGYKHQLNMQCFHPSWLFDDPTSKEFQMRMDAIRITLNVVNNGQLTQWAEESKYPPTGSGFIKDPDGGDWMISFSHLQVAGGINNIVMMNFSDMKLIETSNNVNPF